MALPRVLIAEPSAPVSAALTKFLGGQAQVQLTHFADEAVQLAQARETDVVIAAVSGSFDGEALVAKVRKVAPSSGVILVYPPEEERAFDRAVAAGADVFLSGPLKKSAVLNAVRVVLRLSQLRGKVRALEAEVAAARAEVVELKARPVAPPAPRAKGPGVNTADEAFFKKYMLLEVKRSKRYHYPVALLLVGLDKLDVFLSKESSPEFQRAAIRTEAMAAISDLIRDIDVAMPFAEDKYLVFLPHTPRAGSTIVAERIVKRLSTIDAFEKGTASVGLASFDPTFEPQSSVSFGVLVREASQALKRAQDSGGNKVDAPALPEAAAKPKKNRISMG